MKAIIILLSLLSTTLSFAQETNDFDQRLDSSYHYLRTNDFIKSFVIIEDIKRNQEKIKDSIVIARLYNLDGIINMNSNNFDEAKKSFIISKELYERYHKAVLASIVGTNLAYNDFKNKNFESSKHYYEQSVKTLEEKKSQYVFLGYLGYAQSLFLHDNNLEVIELCDQALSLYDTFDFSKTSSTTKNDIDYRIIRGIKCLKAYAMLESNTSIDEAYNLIVNLEEKESKEHLWEDYTTKDIVDTYKTLYFYKKKDKDSLEFYMNRAYDNVIALKESNFNKDYFSKSNNITALKNELQLNREIENKKTIRKTSNYIIIIVSLLLVLVLTYGYFRKKVLKHEQFLNKRLSVQNRMLQSVIESKKKLEDRLGYIQDNILQEFNDNFGNRLSSLSSSIENLNDLKSNNNFQGNEFNLFLKHLHDQLSNLNEDLKDLSWIMNSESNILSKNIEQIIHHIDQCSKKYNVVINTNVDLEKEIEIPAFWSRQIIDIYKQTISNALVHSKSKRIDISLMLDAQNNFTFICKDYGLGIDMSKFKEKKGMANFRRKVKSINFNMEINTAINTGTEIKVFGKIPKTDLNLDSVLI